MKAPIRLLTVAIAGLLAIGCSTDNALEDSSSATLNLDQVQPIIVPQVVSKDAAVDEADFTMQLLPHNASSINSYWFKIRTPRGCVDTNTTITGDWLGNNEEATLGIDFGPDGQEFLVPLELKFRITPEIMATYNPECLVFVLDNEDGTYTVMPFEWQWNAGTYWMKSDVEHFSKYCIAVGPPPAYNE